MSEYLFTARQADGQRFTDRVEASSSDEAEAVLWARGYNNIVLHTDDVAAAYANPSDHDTFLSPREYVALRQMGGYLKNVAFLIPKLYRISWKLNATFLVVLLARRGFGSPWNVGDGLLLGGLAVPILLALVSPIFSPARTYNRLVEAASWARWEEVLQLLPGLVGKIPAHEAAVRQAQALAGLGRLNEALRVITPFADGSQVPEWLYWSRLADVYHAAGDRESALDALEKAVEVAPDNPVVLLDLAALLLRQRQDTSRARQLLDEVRRHAISDMASPFLSMVEGILALEEGHASQAIGRLEEAMAGLAPYRVNPAVCSVLSLIDKYLSLAYAACGDPAKGSHHFRRAEPRLRALGHHQLLARCQQALGIPVDSLPEPANSDNPYQAPHS